MFFYWLKRAINSWLQHGGNIFSNLRTTMASISVGNTGTCKNLGVFRHHSRQGVSVHLHNATALRSFERKKRSFKCRAEEKQSSKDTTGAGLSWVSPDWLTSILSTLRGPDTSGIPVADAKLEDVADLLGGALFLPLFKWMLESGPVYRYVFQIHQNGLKEKVLTS